MTSTAVKTLFASYEHWCHDHGRRPMHIKRFMAGMSNAYGRQRYQHGYALDVKRIRSTV